MIYGLTGGIASGKSTLTKVAKTMGIAVWDADAVTHDLYNNDLWTMAMIGQHFPDCIDYRSIPYIDRRLLGDVVFSDREQMIVLNDIMGTRLRGCLEDFLRTTKGTRLLDVPLLLESGWESYCDEVIVLHCPTGVQRERMAARGLSPERMDQILSQQWTNPEREPYADHIIDSSAERTLMIERFRQILDRPDDVAFTI
jgi:dephospho-CoA kinase